ncbi:MarR family transcriptional regulator [Pseudochrobactrum algeriensis]|uniref:MarR family winged helix-turn-helix transcriptional regulator n=1 Tax=Pseudochrobactrum algeriensis TaxID=2834768 RepID=UPI001BCE0E0A|nr:MarR family transcriptional regulator [Pseudochrobactrum algeriensis]QVQ36397.1 MarR family transcriptional regulator [Pseudochrobactrum algeriensis]QVQ39615.1 MarR family transcriptional regulator [Pseudochrobactrum algeriensis]QVQ43535.1 MarR family transcriptional regulator [Pseudochrobactrum algeriensis]
MNILEIKHRALLGTETQQTSHYQNMRLCFELLSTAKMIDLSCAQRLAPYQLSESRFVILFLLQQEPEGLAPHLLAERAGITRATLTGLLDGLERDGFILRNHSQTDRRSIIVTLTDKGKQTATSLVSDHSQWIASLMAPLNEQEKQMLSTLLGKIWTAAQEPTDHDQSTR